MEEKYGGAYLHKPFRFYSNNNTLPTFTDEVLEILSFLAISLKEYGHSYGIKEALT